MTVEKSLEGRLRNEVKKMGGLALKYSSPSVTGIPDRIVLMPGGKTYFVELKSSKKKPTPLQDLQIRSLRLLGFDTRVIDDREGLDIFLNQISNDKQSDS